MFIVPLFLLSESHPKISVPLCLLHPNQFSLWVYDAAACSDGKKVKTYKSFVCLPTNDDHCSRVDRKHGLLTFYGTCNKSVPVGKQRFPGLPRTVSGTPRALSRIQACGTSIKAPQGNPYIKNREPGDDHNATFLRQQEGIDAPPPEYARRSPHQ